MHKQMRPRTHFVKAGDVSIAYQVTGDGPVDLIRVPGWISNVDYDWEYPPQARLIERLSRFSRFIRFDKRGTGLSDREVGFPTLEQRMDDVRAVMDAVGSERVVLFGSSEGGNMCILFAATYPERTTGLILHGSQARGEWAADYPWAPTKEETAIHVGECNVRAGDLSGIAVHLASRLLAYATEGDIIVSRTVKDLLVGSEFRFDDKGEVELRDIPGHWQIYSANSVSNQAR